MLPVATTIKRKRTAISRTFLSRPVTRALEDGVIREGSTVFDYGCGRGGDIKRLAQLGYKASGWDPSHAPNAPRQQANVVNIGYVINVIEDPRERAVALRNAWELAEEALVVSARLDWEQRGAATSAYSDGLLTGADTFQKYYTQDGLRAWIDSTLDARSVAAAAGIFYVFRHQDAAQRLLANQTRGIRPHRQDIAELIYQQNEETLEPLQTFAEKHRKLPSPAELPNGQDLVDEFGSIRAAFALIRRVTDASNWHDVDLGRPRKSERRFEQNLPVLQPLLDFVTERGRLPRPDELTNTTGIDEEFGSIRAAFSLIRRVTQAELWATSEQTARDNTLVYVALAAFNGRPRLSELPHEVQYDIKDFYSNYKNACNKADTLLFSLADQNALSQACAQSQLGKLTPEALYIHRDGVQLLSPLLRVYEGCARTLTGTVPGANILKLNRLKPQVSYLAYPDFDTDPHPALTAAVISRIPQLHVTYRNLLDSDNPPILHRKETLVPNDYPGRDKFARLTKQEERHGLLDSSEPIGNRNQWNTLLNKTGFRLRGHQLARA